MDTKNRYKDIHHDLIEAARNHDRSAQHQLYQLYVKAMLNTSFRIVHDPDEAEDVVQEAFVKVFNHIEQYRGESSFGSWIKRIVVNGSLNVLRKNKLDTVGFDEVEDVEEVVIEQELLSIDKVKKAVADLPEGYRAVFSLYAFDGYDHKEIAEILNVSESNSKSQYNRAKKKLQLILKELYNYER
ncbi:MAG: RNA polymerase sigma factor [Reichenbachiella sp.]